MLAICFFLNYSFNNLTKIVATAFMPIQDAQGRMVLVVNFFVFLKKLFCFVVAIFSLMHNVEAIFHLP